MVGRRLRGDGEAPEESSPPGAEASRSLREDGTVASGAEPAGETLTQVRDLLFGPSLRLRDEAIEQLQAKLERQSEELRDEVRQQLMNLERMVKNELNVITERLELEERDRKAVAHDLLGVEKKLSRSIEESGEKASQGQSDLRDQLLAHAKLLTDTIQQRHEETLRRLDEGLDRVETKTDRATLSALLVDVAQRLEGKGSESAKN